MLYDFILQLKWLKMASDEQFSMDLFQLPLNYFWRQSEIKTKPDEQPKAQMGSQVDGAWGRKTNRAFPHG